MTRIKEIFAKLKQGHPLWKNGGEFYKQRLEKAFEPFFDELEQLGVARHFSHALLFYGAEFVDSLDVDYNELSKNESDIADGELMWGVKRNPKREKVVREAELAKKNGLLAYKSMPMKGNQVGIKPLTNKKK